MNGFIRSECDELAIGGKTPRADCVVNVKSLLERNSSTAFSPQNNIGPERRIGDHSGHHFRSSPMLFRSEEHTSELQSHSDLVCRLLLEKKNERNNDPYIRHIVQPYYALH